MKDKTRYHSKLSKEQVDEMTQITALINRKNRRLNIFLFALKYEANPSL